MNKIPKNYIDEIELKKELLKVSRSYNKKWKAISKRNSVNVVRAKKIAKTKMEISDNLIDCFNLITTNLYKRENFYAYYGKWKEEMLAKGFEHLYKYAVNYDEKKGKAFSYCTKICWNGFVQAINSNNELLKKESEEKQLVKELNELEKKFDTLDLDQFDDVDKG